MRLFEGILNVCILSILYFVMKYYAIKTGYTGEFPSQDALCIFDGLIIAGTLARGDS